MRHDTLFAANLHLLTKHHPAAARKIQAGDRPIAARLLPKATSQPNLLVADSRGTEILLHQPDPENESSTYLAKVPKDSHGTVVLFGLGLGYVAAAVLRERPHIQWLIVLERNPAMLRKAMELVDLAPVLTDPRVVLLVGHTPDFDTAVQKAGVTLQLEDIHILRHLPSFAIDPGYQALHNHVFPVLNTHSVAGSSAMRQGWLFLANRLANLADLEHRHGFHVLTDAARGLPAVLIANGPSLDRDLETLARYRDRAIYLAADSCVPTLLAHGIVPDLVGSLDTNPIIYEKLAPVARRLEPCALLCSPQVTTEVSDSLPCRETFLYFGPSIFEERFAPLVGEPHGQENLPTVAHLNLVAALRMGASPIIFVGQDFAYTDTDQTHAKGTRLTCADLAARVSEDKDDGLLLPGVRNTTVRTDRALANAKEFFEGIIQRHPNRYINATSHGAAIAHTEERPLAEVLSALPPLAPERRRPLRIRPIERDQVQARQQAVRHAYQHLLAECREIRSLLHEARATIRRTRQEVRRSSGADQRAIDEGLAHIDALMQRINEHEPFWRLLQELTLKGLKYCNRIRRQYARAEAENAAPRTRARIRLAWFSVAASAQLRAVRFLQRHLERCLSFIDRQDELQQAQDHAGLRDLYLDHDKIGRLHHLLSNGALARDDSAATWLARGIVAGVYREPETQDRCFDKAVALAPELRDRVHEVFDRTGARFLDLARACPDLQIDHASALRLLGDGLTHGRGHQDCLAELVRHARQDAAAAEPEAAIETLARRRHVLETWTKLLRDHQLLRETVPDQEQGRILLACGRLALDEGDVGRAVGLLREAVALLPDTAQAVLALAQALILAGEHAEGIAQLDKAVALDRKCGYYWETLGDALFQAGQPADAAAAYERGFLALPEYAVLLRKIGDCYRATGHLAAATEAYRHFQNRSAPAQATAPH